MSLELCCCTTVLLSEISDKNITQRGVALTYAMALSSSEKTDWAAVNAAIIRRWSRSGLERIKVKAWAIARSGT